MTAEGDQFRALGRVAAAFSHLEFVLSVMVWMLISDEDRKIGQLITAGEGVDALLRRLQSLARYRLGERSDLGRIESFVERARELKDRRNAALHSAWIEAEVSEGSEAPPLWRTVRFTRAGLQEKPFSTEELDRLADNIMGEVRNLYGIMESIPDEFEEY
jgi:hypothetical protein